ncbi:hypothetical protein MXB_1447 [Myxobolus squamalis]|nr:hypothetical protein MXB_1447 [Myxobolus squamalis]
MEKEIKLCKINKIGGICLKNQLRLVINCFAKISKYFVRQHFNKLNKICDILSATYTDSNSLQSLIRSSCDILDHKEIMHLISLRTDICTNPLTDQRIHTS